MRAPAQARAHASKAKPIAQAHGSVVDMAYGYGMAMPLAWPEVVPWFYLAAAKLL